MRTGLRNWNWNCKVDGQLGDHCWFLEDEVVLRGVAVRSLDCYGGSLVAGLCYALCGKLDTNWRGCAAIRLD